MKPINDRLTSSLVALQLLLFMFAPARAQQRPTLGQKDVLDGVSTKKNLYPADADADKEIEEALKAVAGTKKRVLLIFGGNWCYDCHVLDQALTRGKASEIARAHYLIVHVDIGYGEKNPELQKKYKIPVEKGVPAVAILAADGSLLYSSGDGQFESARTMLKTNLIAFLMIWKGP